LTPSLALAPARSSRAFILLLFFLLEISGLVYQIV